MTPRPTPQHPPIGLKGPDGEAASALPPQVVNILAALISRQVLRIIALLARRSPPRSPERGRRYFQRSTGLPAAASLSARSCTKRWNCGCSR